MPSIVSVSSGFGYSHRDPSESTKANKYVEAKHAFEQYSTTFGVQNQKYHANNCALNAGIVALVINLKT